ncbi:glycosyltransferase [Dermatophilus congolensis]|nr:glycosyltransferase [Dermatophilus congolensis]MBO3216973.1 glycosyltransferase [Dermatophilus congolensis]
MAVLIARDEERSIARAVRSVRDAVDRVVVLDTGSEDATILQATRAGAEVYQAPWSDDFSAARNIALEYADADVHLILDADEWLTAGHAWLTQFAHAAAPEYVGIAQVWNEPDLGSGTTGRYTLSERLLPRTVRYRGRVHEQPHHSLPTIQTPLILAHDGYQTAQQQRKRGRNEALIRAELHTNPHNPYLLYQLGKELQATQRFTESAEYLHRAWVTGPPEAPWRHSLVVRALAVLGAAGRFTEALAIAKAEEPTWKESPDYWFALGNLLSDLGAAHATTAPTALPLVEHAWKKCLEIGERPDLEGAVPGRGSWLAAHNLAELYTATGNNHLAQHYAAIATQTAQKP